MEECVYAIRGATTVGHDSPSEVDEAVGELMARIYDENGISDRDAAFILFSQTRDIRTRNAAAACRKAGFGTLTPLFCVQEADISGGLRHTIRVMVLVGHPKEKEPRMVYLRGASCLRPDYSEPEVDPRLE